MDLLEKVAVLAIIIIVIASIAFLIIKQNLGNPLCKPPLASSQAVQCVLTDLQSSNPGANITVVSVTPSNITQGSWHIVFSVVYNGTTPCPSLFIEGFDYPATGFVPSVYNQYTGLSNGICVINGLTGNSPYIAIARSYTQNNPAIALYLSNYGFKNVVVHARYYTQLNKTATPLNKTYYNVWVVNYTGTNSRHSEFAVLNSSYAIIANYSK